MAAGNVINTVIVLFLSTTILFLIYCYIKMKHKLNYWQRKGVKHLKGKLLVGNMSLTDNISVSEIVLKLYQNFPGEKYFGWYQFMIPTLMIKDPELIKQISIRDFDHFVDRQDFADPDVDPFWSRTLFAVHGQKWRDLRTTLSPSFTGNKMKIMFSIIDESCRNFVKYFQEQGEDLIELEMKDIFSRFTNDVIASTSFGLTCDSLRDRNNEFYLMGKEVTKFSGTKALNFFLYMIHPALGKILGLRVISPKVEKYFTKVMKETIEVRERNNIKRPDMLYLLMEAMNAENKGQDKITIDDIIPQAMIFFFAGFETVSTFLMYCFYELALNPEIQNRLRQEILAIDGEITYDKLLSMKYLEMVASETMRLWPPVGTNHRQVTKPISLEAPGMKPVDLELGTIVWLPSIAIQRDPKYFPDPERFDPERFNDENRSKIVSGTYSPFGFGPRNCIGNRFALLESKLLICHILRNFEIVRVERTMVPIVFDPQDFTLSPKGGMWLGFKRLLL